MRMPFEHDPKITHPITLKQTGSIAQAIIELLINAVEANAKSVCLTMTKEHFSYSDNGHGFASFDDVLRYFGRISIPQSEGEATYRRLRLGHGKILAHASTTWVSNRWSMTVDTRLMGYNYELEDLPKALPGCTIKGTWYKPLKDTDVMSAIQEVYEGVRYASISVELNGHHITCNPAQEEWDFEDGLAYYRLKEEGPVSVYNQGILVRHDSSHVWGGGGLIVSKQAIRLNVSRTEILRNTCPVWKAIAKTFSHLIKGVSGRLYEDRKSEARREMAAHSLLSGNPNIGSIYSHEEVITLMPGKRHISLHAFLQKAHYLHGNTISVVEFRRDVSKGEAIAREGHIQVVHPITLERFGCTSCMDFVEILERVLHNVAQDTLSRNSHLPAFWKDENPLLPRLVSFSALQDTFQERTRLVDEKNVLDKEIRRAWIDLRCCLQHYACACIGAAYSNDSFGYDHHPLQVLLGESNTYEAWTDGKTYLAIDYQIVKRLKADALKTVAYLFGLVEHEVAHQGDSFGCGDDEAFNLRYKKISLGMAPERQRFIHMWLMKYAASLESERKKARGRASNKRYLFDRPKSGHLKCGPKAGNKNVSTRSPAMDKVPEHNPSLSTLTNQDLDPEGVGHEPPDVTQTVKQARLNQMVVNDRGCKLREALAAGIKERDPAIQRDFEEAKAGILSILGIDALAIDPDVLLYLCECWVWEGHQSREEVLRAWEDREWETPRYDMEDEHEYTCAYSIELHG